MRQFIFLLFLLPVFGNSNAQTPTTVPGYYVTYSNDTVYTKIKLPKLIFGGEDLSKFIYRVEIVDSFGERKKLKPEDIKSYGFSHNGISHRLF
ncbi:hypothetical protein [Chitinophaga solisilvae]|uniref:hypothetical protein n=1 Tax=Chitinophaga solisilvae TaxID=1233460 RepID=UPI00136B2F44|nr:hypothetical protein [Chitinophaga solisilvae]